MYSKDKTSGAITAVLGYHTTSGGNNEFYELEPAVVLDVIVDSNHPIFKRKNLKINPNQWPDDITGNPAINGDVDYTWIGRCLVRPLLSQQGINKEQLTWALPLENTGIVELPLINETVIVVKYFNILYYSKKLNINNFSNHGVDFKKEKSAGLNDGNREFKFNTFDMDVPFKGPISYTVSKKYTNIDNTGVVGRYFWINNNVRNLKKFEGDTIIESRFGQSIRFGAYDNNRNNDKGFYKDYISTNVANNPISNTNVGGGNPMILIRNRQRQINNTPIEKNTGSSILEDINNDGSSIHITSGLTESPFISNIKKSIFQINKEEISPFSPENSTVFKFPKLVGDQIVINSDRIILSSKNAETLHFSKKRYAVSTDDEYTVDAQNQIVITSNTKTVLNSPAIYLGEYDQTNEPALLGQTTVDFLYDLCDWLLDHVHGYNHVHPHPHTHEDIDSGSSDGVVGDAIPQNTLNADPPQSQISIQQESLLALKNSLGKLLSKRVFLTGGGYAPGKYNSPNLNTNINTFSGEGVPGGYFGNPRRENPQ